MLQCFAQTSPFWRLVSYQESMGLRNRKILQFLQETTCSVQKFQTWSDESSRSKKIFHRLASRVNILGVTRQECLAMFVWADQAFRNPPHTPFISHNFPFWMYFPKLKVSDVMGWKCHILSVFFFFNFSMFCKILGWDFASICRKYVVYILSCSENCNHWPCSPQLLALIHFHLTASAGHLDISQFLPFYSAADFVYRGFYRPLCTSCAST